MKDYQNWLQGAHDCACGREHHCPIDHVEIGNGAVKVLPILADGFHHILLVADENTYFAQGKTVENLLRSKIEYSLVYPGDTVLVPDETAINCVMERVTDQTDLIVGVGSGVINDLCKYVSFQNNLPYYIVATATSMDGYASNSAALILKGMKISPSARPPKAIVADTAVLKNAPMEMIQAGYGDIMGKLSCLNDWKLSRIINEEYFCDRIYDLTYNTVMELLPLASKLLERDEQAIGQLMDALVIVGIAMCFVGNSRPASGSEHHLSHYFEITGIVHNRPYYPHGIDVAYSAVLTAKLRQKILAEKPVRRAFVRDAWEAQIRRAYGPVAQGVIALQDKLDSYQKFGDRAEWADWERIRACLAEAPSPAQMQEIVESIGLRYSDFEAFYGEQVLEEAVHIGKDLKDRYTLLWLYDQFFS